WAESNRASACRSGPGRNSACTSTLAQSGVCAGGGSSSGVSVASSSDTASAPARLSSASAASTWSRGTRKHTLCQLMPAFSPQAEALLEIVDVGAASFESRVLKDFVMQRHVGANAVDDHFV